MSNQRSETWGLRTQQVSTNRAVDDGSREEGSQQWGEASREGDVKGRQGGYVQYESQVQDNIRSRVVASGNHSQGTINRDNRPNISYFCNRCKKCVKEQGYTAGYTHEQHIADCWPDGVEGTDYIECKLCKFAALKITQHVKIKHNLSKEEYEVSHGPVKCTATTQNYSRSGSQNGDWIKRKKEAGEDLSGYIAKMGAAVSRSIMSNSEERTRRADVMAGLNRTPEARERSSRAAKITSARSEIQEQRATALANWRKNNFEEFYETCFKAMLNSPIKVSKPERVLREFLPPGFSYGYIVKSERLRHINKSCRKQVDFADPDRNIYIEMDGHHHFMVKFNETLDSLELIKEKDRILDRLIVERGGTLIRISYDQFSYKGGGHFTEPCLRRLYDILQDPQPGVHCIGDAYNGVNT